MGRCVLSVIALYLTLHFFIALNLKAFHADKSFLGTAFYVPLSRYSVMRKVVEIVGGNIPNLVAVDLSENRLPALDGVVQLLEKAPHVKILYLAKNKVIYFGITEEVK